VIALPGVNPTSPVITVGPVLVIVAAANTAKEEAELNVGHVPLLEIGGEGVGVGVGGGQVIGTVHAAAEIKLVSKVTAAVKANALPNNWEFVFIVIEAVAITFPTITEDTPRVAELPTFQYTFPGNAPLISITRCATATIKVEGI